MDNAEDENTSLPSNLKSVGSLLFAGTAVVVSWLFEACFLLFQVKKAMYTIVTNDKKNPKTQKRLPFQFVFGNTTILP